MPLWWYSRLYKESIAVFLLDSSFVRGFSSVIITALLRYGKVGLLGILLWGDVQTCDCKWGVRLLYTRDPAQPM